MEDWVGIYKFARLAVLALALAGIAFHLYRRKNKERLEAPARRMLEDDE
jgi:cbb3-type cytochrome oxidase subunit 3